MKKGPVPVIVDTRSAATYAKGHIEGSLNIPAYPPGVSVQMGLLGLPKDQLIVFYCD
jgi:rhodanese-related sulfurtransferase